MKIPYSILTKPSKTTRTMFKTPEEKRKDAEDVSLIHQLKIMGSNKNVWFPLNNYWDRLKTEFQIMDIDEKLIHMWGTFDRISVGAIRITHFFNYCHSVSMLHIVGRVVKKMKMNQVIKVLMKHPWFGLHIDDICEIDVDVSTKQIPRNSPLYNAIMNVFNSMSTSIGKEIARYGDLKNYENLRPTYIFKKFFDDKDNSILTVGYFCEILKNRKQFVFAEEINRVAVDHFSGKPIVMKVFAVPKENNEENIKIEAVHEGDMFIPVKVVHTRPTTTTTTKQERYTKMKTLLTSMHDEEEEIEIIKQDHEIISDNWVKLRDGNLSAWKRCLFNIDEAKETDYLCVKSNMTTEKVKEFLQAFPFMTDILVMALRINRVTIFTDLDNNLSLNEYLSIINKVMKEMPLHMRTCFVSESEMGKYACGSTNIMDRLTREIQPTSTKKNL
jgi:hypothetical protein